jgi:predicted nucleotidyltransferase
MARGALPPDVAHLVAAYRHLLVARFGARVELVRLFGSRARGDEGVDSDADVAVVIAGVSEFERTAAVELAVAAWRETGCGEALLSPLVWSSDEFAARVAGERRIALDVLQEGIDA